MIGSGDIAWFYGNCILKKYHILIIIIWLICMSSDPVGMMVDPILYYKSSKTQQKCARMVLYIYNEINELYSNRISKTNHNIDLKL